MSQPISIGVSFANSPNEVDFDGAKRFISLNQNNFQAYSLPPSRPGVFRAGAFDLMLILGAVGSIASLASILWMVYEKFIAPKKSTETSDAGIYIGITKPDGTVIDFWIGKDYMDKDIFIQDFYRSIKTIRESKDSEYFFRTELEIKQSYRLLNKE